MVNGPTAGELDINAGYNALGQGWRANATIAADGLNKAQIKSWLYEHSQILAGRFSPGNFARYTQRLGPQTAEVMPETYVGSAFSAADILIVVAGGAGKHSCFVPTFGHTRAITRPIALKDGTAVPAVEAFI